MRSRLARHVVVVSLVALLLVPLARPSPARADDAYFRVPVGQLKVVEGKFPSGQPDASDSDEQRGRLTGPRVIVASPAGAAAEAYAGPADASANSSWGVDLN